MNRLSNILTGIIIGEVAAAGLIAGAAVEASHAHATTGQHQRVDIPRWVVRPCATDDSVNCRWIPSKAFNHNHPHLGGWNHTSIRRQVPGSKGMVCVFYANHRYARHHDYCS